jgi:hypothetical protein
MSIYAVIFAILSSVAPSCSHVSANGDPAVAALIEDGSRASATVRQLMAAIDCTNGPHGILRVLVHLHRELSALIGALGHELQHALEVLSDMRLTTTQAAHLFCARKGQP